MQVKKFVGMGHDAVNQSCVDCGTFDTVEQAQAAVAAAGWPLLEVETVFVNLILNESQAEMVYSAMSYLNNVSGRISVDIDGADGSLTRVNEYNDGTIRVMFCPANVKLVTRTEHYANQAAFCTAYGRG